MTACGSSSNGSSASAAPTATPQTTQTGEIGDTGETGETGETGDTATSVGSSDLWDSTVVHEISVTYDQAAYSEMIATFQESGGKEWIEATVTIDGTTYENVGLRLKGNSTLQGLKSGSDGGGGQGPGGGATADDPESLPWLIRLDKYVDGQNDQGTTDLIVRANNSATSLNEALGLKLVGLAGLATQEAAPTRFTVNGGEPVLRLTIQNPDDTWEDENFESDGILYKAESGGDWSYRGDDPESYVDVFEQETDTDHANLTPLIEFLDFINNSDDETFAAELGDRLDIEAFATYLAVQELINNTDDIDGPGNNSYLEYNIQTGVFTVVNWDLNLAFGGLGGVGGGGARGGAGNPGGFGGDAAGRGDGGGGDGDGGRNSRSNILVERFLANEEFAALYQQTLDELTATLYTSGAAQQILDTLAATLTSQAGDLVDAATVADEAASLAQQFVQ